MYIHRNQKFNDLRQMRKTIYLHFIKAWIYTSTLWKNYQTKFFFSVKLQSKKNAAASASTSSTTPVATEFTVSKTFHILFIRQCLAFSLDNLDYDTMLIIRDDSFTNILTLSTSLPNWMLLYTLRSNNEKKNLRRFMNHFEYLQKKLEIVSYELSKNSKCPYLSIHNLSHLLITIITIEI